jgi:uncharacterized protein YjfI (DUF2170 family)
MRTFRNKIWCHVVRLSIYAVLGHLSMASVIQQITQQLLSLDNSFGTVLRIAEIKKAFFLVLHVSAILVKAQYVL